MFLSYDEIVRLTGRIRQSAQARALRSMGIEHRVRPDGEIIVSRSHVEKVLDGSLTTTPKKRTEPDWRSI